MKTRTLLLGAVALAALTSPAYAGQNWYVGIESGANWISDVDAVGVFDPPGITITTLTGTIETDSGWAILATTGFSIGERWRLEGELGYRENMTTSDYIEVAEWSLMLNVLHDIPLSPNLDLTLGAGIGYDFATLDFFGILDDTDSNFAYQGIAGLSFGLSSTADLTLTYRYLGVQGPSFSVSAGGYSASADLDDVSKHALTVGIRFNLSPSQ
jgi:OmpA-OmpF porin, OOP family